MCCVRWSGCGMRIAVPRRKQVRCLWKPGMVPGFCYCCVLFEEVGTESLRRERGRSRALAQDDGLLDCCCRAGRAAAGQTGMSALPKSAPKKTAGTNARRHYRHDGGATCFLPDAAWILRHHRLSHFAAKCFAELGEVLHRSVGAVLAGRVGVGLCGEQRCFWFVVLAPDLSEADEEALCRCESIFLGIHVFALLLYVVHQCGIGDAQPAVVGGVLA